jgi:hypothetical protein
MNVNPGEEEYDVSARLIGTETAAIARCMADCDDVPRGQLSTPELRRRGVYVRWPSGDPVYMSDEQTRRQSTQSAERSRPARLSMRTPCGKLAFIS